MRTNKSFYEQHKYWETPFDKILIVLLFIFMLPVYICYAAIELLGKENSDVTR